jgi:hypothetical protein
MAKAKQPGPFMTDDESPELTAANFADARPFAEAHPELYASINKGG